ncbi:hypothetical protein GCE9029_02299 [Grimontia celer]|uniref:Uncharacterized protein n=1 Tax=Grimontia celer TaxID=1796497 RepID=A0A128F3F7_9GAMM|nr:hypothetical protein GCE9029_02299 [Grimontia celer]
MLFYQIPSTLPDDASKVEAVMYWVHQFITNQKARYHSQKRI